MEFLHSDIVVPFLGTYNWKLSILTFVGIMLATAVGGQILRRFPGFKEAHAHNTAKYEEKMQIPRYAANQKMNRKWAVLDMAVIFGIFVPFAVTLDMPVWWMFLVHVFVILMVYDFVYYLTHRFLFHDGGPLVWVHAVHHQQRNPIRNDGSYIHPLEVAAGLGLYTLTIFGLSYLMGDFNVVTIITTWVAFSAINNHNHVQWSANHFPFKYLNYASFLHHNHHAKFTGGNFATITPLYDWMFGSLDKGNGWGKHKREPKQQPAE